MTSDSIKEVLTNKPWHPVEILLNGGETIRVSHPETIFVGKENIVVEKPDGGIHFFDPEDVCKIQRVTRRKKAA